ncbi:MAG TPA: hypothetical protein VIR03_03675, partial [Candidatus Saccharimonadales bacterium]
AQASLTKADGSLQASNNLSDLAAPATARTNLGLGTAATMTPATLAGDAAFTGAYVRHGDLVLHVKDYGAVGDGVTDDTTAIQTAVLAAINSSAILVFGLHKTYKITSAIAMGPANTTAWTLDGQSSTIIQYTNNTQIFHFTNENVNRFTIANFTLKWNSAQPVTNTTAIAIHFDSSTSLSYGWYNFELSSLTFSNGYQGIASSSTASPNTLIWGADFSHLYYTSSMSGAAVRLTPGAGGDPNNHIHDSYFQGIGNTTEPIIWLSNQTALCLSNLEFNDTFSQEISINTADGFTILACRSERPTLNANYQGKWVISNSRGEIIGSTFQTVTTNVANWAFLIRCISSAAVRIGTLSLLGAYTATSGSTAMLAATGASNIIYDGPFFNNPGINPFYLFDDTPSHIVRYNGNDFRGTGIQVQKIITSNTSQAAATTVAAGAAAGSSPTATITGNDTAGSVAVTLGTGPTSGTLFTVTFGVAYSATPKSVQITPGSSGNGTAKAYVSALSTTGFSVSVEAAAPGNMTYYYLVLG